MNTSKSDNEKSEIDDKYLEILISLERVIFNLNPTNLEFSIEQTMKIFDINYPNTFNFIIIKMVYDSFCTRKTIKDIDLFIMYLLSIQKKKKRYSKNKATKFPYFIILLNHHGIQDAKFFIEKLIDKKILGTKIIKKFPSKLFAHYQTEKENKFDDFHDLFSRYFLQNYEKLSKNNFELHKKLIKEGTNPNEISRIIRNDEIEKLQEIVSRPGFNISSVIFPSLYEKCYFINGYNSTLIDYAAFFSSVKCFKFLLMNGASLENTGKYAVAGGNEEIIHLCEQNHSSFEGAYEAAIKFHRNDIFYYIYDKKSQEDMVQIIANEYNIPSDESDESDEFNLENQFRNTTLYDNYNYYSDEEEDYSPHELILTTNDVQTKFLNYLQKKCILYSNYEILSYLQKEEKKCDYDLIKMAVKFGNLLIVKYYLQINPIIPSDILIHSSKSGNIELVQYALEQEEIYINTKDYIYFNILIF